MNKFANSLLAVGAFVAGLLVGPFIERLIDPLIDTTDKLIIAGIAALILVVLIIGVIVITLTTHESGRFQAITKNVEDISKNLGLRVEFFPHDPLSPKKDPYEIMNKLVRMAKREYYVLDHRPTFNPPRFYDTDSPKAKSRVRYYNAMTKMARRKISKNEYFSYKRVVQLDEGNTNVWDVSINGDNIFADHCKDLIEFHRKNRQSRATIKTSRVFYPNASIVIVDGKVVLLELAINGPDGKVQVEGDLIFNDPDGVIATPIKTIDRKY